MTEAMPGLPQKKRIFCNQCKTETNHFVQAHHSRLAYYEEETGYWDTDEFLLWICAGCDTATLEFCYTSRGLEDKEGNQIYQTVDYYPQRAEHSVTGKQFKQLPEKLDTIYRETIIAFNSGADVLCAIGLRALIEGICADKNVTGRSLEERIDRLVVLLPANIVSSLHSFRFIGNTAAHELSPPNKNDLRIAIEVSEDLLNYLYELDYKASRLPKPTRRKL